MEIQVCTRCKKEKDIELFRSKYNKINRICRPCMDKIVNPKPKERESTHPDAKKCNKCKKTRDPDQFIGKKGQKTILCKMCRDRGKMYGIKAGTLTGKGPESTRVKHYTIEGVECKKCSKCGSKKPLTQFYKTTTISDGRRSRCKECMIEDYHSVSDEEKQERAEKLKVRKKRWNKENRDHINEYIRNKRKEDPSFRISGSLRSRLRIALNDQNVKKRRRTFDLIGCSIAFLCEYLESLFKDGMTWENYGEWHIDHIKPCSKFDLTKKSQQRKCFHYTNLQPLWATDNLKKGNRYYRLEFVKFEDHEYFK